MKKVYFYKRGQFKSNQLVRHSYGKEEPMHGADEFLCRNCVILKCEAVALVGHRRSSRESIRLFFPGHMWCNFL